MPHQEVPLPGPPRVPSPSSRAGRVAAHYAPSVVTAVITAGGMVGAAWVAGMLKAPDMSETNAALHELVVVTQDLKRWQERHDDKHELIDKRDQDRRREVDARFAQQRVDIQHNADSVVWRRHQ